MSQYVNHLSATNKIARLMWGIIYILLFRYTPATGFRRWRLFLLKVFRADVSWKSNVYPSTKIWAPWNLVMREYACLAEGVDCYNVAKITLGENVTVSQRAFLCSASHDITDPAHSLTAFPIFVESRAWVCAEAFVGPGTTIGKGAVLAARAVAVKDLDDWCVYGGNPAKCIKNREING